MATENQAAAFGPVTAGPASKTTGCLETRLETGETVRTPLTVINGRRPGPTLVLTAGIHGIELNGIETLARVCERTDPETLAGTIAVVPVAHRAALDARLHNPGSVPGGPKVKGDPTAMNQFWPGDPAGTRTERLAHTIFDTVVRRGDCVIDFHCHARFSASMTIANRFPEASAELAGAFGLPVIYAGFTEKKPRGTVTHVAGYHHGIPALCIELSGQWDLFEESIAEGLRGVFNVMKHLGMMPGNSEPAPALLDDRGARELAAPVAGLVMPAKRPGERVRKSTVLCYVRDVENLEQVSVTSPVDGVITRLGAGAGRRFTDVSLQAMHAFVDKGEVVARVTPFKA